MKLKLTFMIVSILGIAACTHTPSVGEKMLTHSDESKRLSKQWNEGEKNIFESKKLEKRSKHLINSGNKKIVKGKKLVTNGEKELTKGNDMLALSNTKLETGQHLQQESKSQFSEQFPGKLD